MSKHNLANVQLTIGTTLIKGGFGVTDAITIENEEPIATMTFGADGHAVPSYNNVNARKATITMMPTSASYTLLSATMEIQIALSKLPGPLLPQPFLMVDANNGTTLFALESVFLERPTPSRGKAVGEETFVLSLNKITEVRGPLNLT